MKLNRWLLPMLSILLCSTAVAQDPDQIRVVSHTTVLSERIAEMEHRLASLEVLGDAMQKDGNGKNGKGGKGYDDWCDPCPGWYANSELLLLYWHDTNNDANQNAVHTGSRHTVGLMREGGTALQMRYFEFASQTDGGDDLMTEHIDLEYLGRFTLGCNWQGDIALGGRWASFRNTQDTVLHEDTFGPLIGVSLRNQVRDNIAIYGGARHSMQFGRDVASNQPNDTFSISEINLGLELTRDWSGSELFLRSGYEAQYYHSVVDDEEDIGLPGFTLSLGVRR